VAVPRGHWRRVVDSGEERFGGFGPKTPTSLNVSGREKVRIDMIPWGAAIFLRAGDAVAECSAATGGAA